MTDTSRADGETAYSYRFPAIEEVVVGASAAEAFAARAERIGANRVVLVTSRSLENGALVASIAAALGSRHAGTFGGVKAHTPRGCVLAGADFARAASADLLVSIGGGSVIDATKGIQLCVWHALATNEQLQRFRDDGMPPPPSPAAGTAILRAIAVPTTLSAAEFNALAGITDHASHRKELYSHPLLAPRFVVLDPEALARTPVALILSTGVRTVDHCVEGFCSTGANPFADALAVRALQLLRKHLPEVHQGTATKAAFRRLQTAAWMAITGLAGGVPVGASHVIGRVLGAVSHVDHGHTSAILLPAVLAWNAQVPALAARQEELASALGLDAQPLGEAIGAFFAALGQPRSLSAAGVARADLPKIADYALTMTRDATAAGYARRIASTEQVREILDLAW